MPELLKPDMARRLLVTAATRQHAAAVLDMSIHKQLGYIHQHVNAATLEVMLFELRMSYAYLDLLIQLPAAAHLSSDAVIRLLLLFFSLERRSCPVPTASSTAG
jgi:hypothetical protein